MNMQKDNVIERVTESVTHVLEREQGQVDCLLDLSTIGMDSMRSVALIVELEEAFDIVFDDEELMFENFSTIDKIAGRVLTKLVSAAS
ncbi:acyl carrier protein [Paenibacillus sp. IB182496]|uniref:Acyl carrier protein n=1 Tax=Paenibacillus sabuli TaxID=2772509 RepID=A0A927GU97_9BACL|nr:phosphopantetheine-binding protein [Paenibacillus sabuli]MBD2847472.1 acyl carrier protein [Paenibacillus sabuli]